MIEYCRLNIDYLGLPPDSGFSNLKISGDGAQTRHHNDQIQNFKQLDFDVIRDLDIVICIYL